MLSKLLIPIAVGAALSLPAVADSVSRKDQTGEALAWTVAAYASCETPDALQADYREEAARMEADIVEVLASLRILAEADNICGNLGTYAMDMLAMAEYDMPGVEARLITHEQPIVPVFETEDPKGAGTHAGRHHSLILAKTSDGPLGGAMPPASSPTPPSSDYQE